jgi:predicted dehydrogenase
VDAELDGERRLAVGYVGCGYITDIHLTASRLAGPVRVVGAVDVSEKAARSFVERAGEGEVLGLEDLVHDPDVDIVFVCTPHDVRHEPLVEAARAGRLVVCEKPLALDAPSARAVADSLGPDANRVVLGFNQRFMAGPTLLRAALREGGRPPSALEISLVAPGFLNSWAGLPRSGGGVLVGLGSHAVDMTSYLTGQRLGDVRAFASRVRLEEPYLEDVATIVGRLPSGAPVTITVHDHGSEWWSMDLERLLQVRAFTETTVLQCGVSDLHSWALPSRQSEHVSAPGRQFLEAWGYADLSRAVRTWAFTGRRDERLATVDDGLACAVAIDEAVAVARPDVSCTP